jgi:Uma2 family endonuclease
VKVTNRPIGTSQHQEEDVSMRDVIDVDTLLREGAVRLEITSGVPTWEASPGSRHQRIIDLIRATIEPMLESDTGCDCVHYSDVDIRFPDGSFKRPDIAIFCNEPPLQDESLTVLPCAVIEIISPGYEYKDTSLNPPFYLSQGLLDVVIVDPRTGMVTYYSQEQVTHLTAPVVLELRCGCRCAIPALK